MTRGYVSYGVGEPWPHGPAADGMTAIITPAEGAPNVMLAIHMAKPATGEVKAVRQGALRIGIWASSPLTWLIVDAGPVSLDAPYSVGITSDDHRGKILASAQAMTEMAETERVLITLALIDRGVTAVLRGVSMSPAWARALSSSILAAPGPLSRAAYDAAIARDSRLTTQQMLVQAQAVEAAGRL